MKIPFRLPGLPDGPALVLDRSLWTGRTRLYADNQELKPQPKNGLFDKRLEFHVPLPDGSHRQLLVHNRVHDPVPEVYVDGQAVFLTKKLQIWEYIVACLPLLLVVGGGLLGGGVGAGAVILNLSVMRSNHPAGVRVALCLGILLAAFLVLGLVYNAVMA
ncbi:hypothetical protein [Hymenobacter weizhouensis]|uniref:hypothetical protein n=1 Tax=Hymenobacter sp. YIM 151500-1 TaxID=2987689 RepID=UPI0022271C55|nr:hypothetical protein [Hymenobacter sp. YIM 151500-1]UYZ61740.1 hypothetical protein OIS53_12085 [Hymenobacter sp. YIM 151500-1]